jgi:hypothetical protein
LMCLFIAANERIKRVRRDLFAWRSRGKKI